MCFDESYTLTRVAKFYRPQTDLISILCSEKSNERVELLALDGRGIKVADYWTQLPDKKLLEQKLHEAVILARGLSERK